MAAGVGTLAAQDRHDLRYDRQDLREDYRDLGQDYARADRMRAEMARDQARLNEDIRCGRTAQARRDAQDLARDRRALGTQMRDIHPGSGGHEP